MLSSNPNLKTAEFSKQTSNHKYVVSNVRSISEHVEVEQGVGFQGEGAWPHAAPLQRAEPEERSRFLPWFCLGVEGASAHRQKEP